MPKNKKGGIVTNTIFGVGGLIIAVIVILVIVSTIKGADIIPNDSKDTYTILNESVTFGDQNVAQTLGAGAYVDSTCNAITYIANQTTTGASLSTSNITRTGCSVLNASKLTSAGWGGNGTMYVSYTWTQTKTTSKNTLTNLTTNFTGGIDNISSKVPTILLIVAVVFLFGALVLLIRNAQSMGVFGGSGGGSL